MPARLRSIIFGQRRLAGVEPIGADGERHPSLEQLAYVPGENTVPGSRAFALRWRPALGAVERA